MIDLLNLIQCYLVAMAICFALGVYQSTQGSNQ